MVSLERCKLFQGVPLAEMDSLRQVTHERRFGLGEIIFKQGAPGDGIYVVKDGVVEICVVPASGEPRVVAKLGPGELFGEMAVVDSDPRSATARAGDTTIVYFISRQDLLSTMERAPQLAMGLVREISRRLREFNRQYVRDVLDAERMALIGKFASSIIHDIKNPLHVIAMSAELSAVPNASLEARNTSRARINKQVDRIIGMVNELLEFARGSSTSCLLARLDYGQFVQQIVDEARQELSLKSVTIQTQGTLPSVNVQMNQARLTRVFYNLFNNAADAIGSGGRITVRVQLDKEGVLTEVQDTGPGLPPEIADKLFQPFVTYGKAHGTGLGLSITKKTIEDHGGRLAARNAPNGGAIFSFTLPIQPD